MTIRIINTVPGTSTDPISPNQDLQLSVQSTDSFVSLTGSRIAMGTSCIQHSTVLPELDSVLENVNTQVVLESPERERPVDGEITRAIVGGKLQLTRGSGTEKGIYEISNSISSAEFTKSSLLCHVEFDIDPAWSTFSPHWLNLNSVVCPYFCLEHSQSNTGLFLFLRKVTGHNSIVIRGPLAAPYTTPPTQHEYEYDWTAASKLAFCIFFNAYTSDGEVEIYVKSDNNDPVLLCTPFPFWALGQYPGWDSTYSNKRREDTDNVTLFMGNAGQAGDVLKISDWTLYPDFRVTAIDGIPAPQGYFHAIANSPVIYDVTKAKLPTEQVPGRYFIEGAAPSTEYRYLPGRRSSPFQLAITKSLSSAKSAYYRDEPALESRIYGISMESTLSGLFTYMIEGCTGGGFGASDGAKVYNVIMVKSDEDVRFFGILKDVSKIFDLDGYWFKEDSPGVPTALDYEETCYVRLVVDRLRGKVSLFVTDSDIPILTKNISDEFPDDLVGTGKFRFGHILGTTSAGTVTTSCVAFLSRYVAWEGTDNLLPDASGIDSHIRFTPEVYDPSTGGEDGSSVMSSSKLVITKINNTLASSKRYYHLEQHFGNIGNLEIDFRFKIASYKNISGTLDAINSSTGVGLRFELGLKRLQIGFFNTSAAGRVVAIIPGSLDTSHIINQTPEGRAFSAPIDWRDMHSYRICLRAYNRLQVRIDTKMGDPSIDIPWRDDRYGFDLPESIHIQCLEFGHLEGYLASVSEWEFLRWGIPSGYDVGFSQEAPEPEGFQPYHFGGKAFVLAEFNEL